MTHGKITIVTATLQQNSEQGGVYGLHDLVLLYDIVITIIMHIIHI